MNSRNTNTTANSAHSSHKSDNRFLRAPSMMVLLAIGLGLFILIESGVIVRLFEALA